MNKYLIDLIIFPIISFFWGISLLMNVPGYGETCDQDAYFILPFLLIFITISIAFLVRNSNELSKNKKNTFRKISLIAFIVLTILSLGGLNKLIFVFWFGELKYQANSTKNNLVHIKLFENGKFFSEGYNTSCSEEITGTYKIEADILELEFDKKSDFISKKYKIKEQELINFDQKKDTLLIDNKSTKLQQGL